MCAMKVSSELDARFCSGCGLPIHIACVPKDVLPSPELCGFCGTRLSQSTGPSLSAMNSQIETGAIEQTINRLKPLIILLVFGVFALSSIGLLWGIKKDEVIPALLRLAVVVVSCVVTPLLAARKGYSWVVWVFGGSVLGLLILAFQPFANAPGLTPKQQKQLEKKGNSIGIALTLMSICITLIVVCIFLISK
jgi:hypothetical protein